MARTRRKGLSHRGLWKCNLIRSELRGCAGSAAEVAVDSRLEAILGGGDVIGLLWGAYGSVGGWGRMGVASRSLGSRGPAQPGSQERIEDEQEQEEEHEGGLGGEEQSRLWGWVTAAVAPYASRLLY